MALGVNLHDVVRSAITALHPDLDALLYRGRTIVNLPDGSVRAAWSQKLAVKAQVQSEKTHELEHDGQVSSERVERKFYLYSDFALADRVAGVVRPLSRPGDMLRLDHDGSWWLVTAVLEDFTRSGWTSVRCTLQTTAPDLSMTPEVL